MQRFKAIISEIHRRSIWQVLTIYLVGSWIGYQVVLALTAGLGLPDWVPGFAVALVVIGLPIVLATAFIQEGGPVSTSQRTVRGVEVEGLETTAPVGGRGDPAPAPVRTAPVSAPARMFTWNRAITAGVLAFAMLGLAATGFMGMRTLGIGPAATLMSRGIMDARDPIVLADFGNTTADDRIGEVVTDALRIDLLASPVIELVGDARIRETLGRMRLAPDQPLDSELALEVAVRDGYKAVITGEIGSVGAGYVLTARVVSAETGESLAGFRETASGEGDLLSAIDRLSGAIRARIGESLRSTRTSEPLERVTTSSLDALRLYSQAIRVADREGQLLRSVDLLEEAVARDPGFAMAHRRIAVTFANLGVERNRMVEAATRAYELRERLNERERGLAAGFYHRAVTGDRVSAIAAYQNILDRFPDEAVALNNLALAYNDAGEFAAAEAVLRPPYEAGRMTPTQYYNLARAIWGQGRAEEAQALVVEFRHRYPESPMPALGAVLFAAASHDWAPAETALEDLQAAFATSAVAMARALLEGAYLDVAQGRLRAGTARLARLSETGTALGLPSAAAFASAFAASLEAELLRDPRRLEQREAELEARIPAASLEPLDRPHLTLALAWVRVGDVDRAEAHLRAYESEVPASRRGYDVGMVPLIEGMIAVRRGQFAAGIARIERAVADLPCAVCGLDELGRAHELAGDTDAALAAYTAYLETRELERAGWDASALPFVLQRLAELHADRGDRAAAAGYLDRFVAMWAGADAELQPRVESARRQLAHLAAER